MYVGLLSHVKDLTLNAFLAVVGTAEAGSEHPIAKAVSSYAKQVFPLAPATPTWARTFVFTQSLKP